MAASDEVCFPRGGVASRGTKRKAPHSEGDTDLFKVTSDTTLSGKKTTKKSKKPKLEKKEKDADGQHGKSVPPNAEFTGLLTMKGLAEDMLILGCVREVRDFEILVGLPNNVTGIVPITDISDTYTALLQRLTEQDQTLDIEEVSGLQDLFRCGMLVRCKVMSMVEGERSKLSVNPRHINHSFSASTLKNGIVLPGCVSSREDHGYLIDLGIKGVIAFLKNKDAESYIAEYNEGLPFRIGSYLTCMVSTAKHSVTSGGKCRTVSVVINPKQVHKSEVTDIKLYNVLPGMIVKCQVTEVLEHVIKVKFFSYSATIHKTHLRASPDKYGENQEIRACVLFVHPTTKAVVLTQLKHLIQPELDCSGMFGDLARGDVIDDAVVSAVNNNGVYFDLGDRKPRVRALAIKFHLSDEEVEHVRDTFPEGTKHKCRVLNFDYMDKVVRVTLKPSLIKERFMTYAQIEEGTTVKCIVDRITEKGVNVKLSRHLSGFIPNLHLAEVLLKHPEKKFKHGHQLTCKVLSVVAEKNRVILTNKKSLLSSTCPVITSYDQCKRGMILEAMIYLIKKKALSLAFYGDVKGFVPRNQIGRENDLHPEKLFSLGQVIRCQVLLCEPENNKLMLTLKVDESRSPVSKPVQVPSDFEVGKLVRCRIQQRVDKGFNVELLPSKLPAFLPTMHLSDHITNCSLLLDTLRKGDILKDVMYIDKTKVITITKKPSLLKASQQGMLVKEFSQLKTGILLNGFLRSKKFFGVFVNMLNGLVGLVPTKYICDEMTTDPASLYQEGQSVVAKVTELDSAKNRIVLSMRMQDCFDGENQEGVELLENYLDEYQMVLHKMKTGKGPWSGLKLTIGQVVTCKVTEQTDDGIFCVVFDKIKGFSSKQHNAADETLNLGDKKQAVVLYVDPHTACVEVSFNKSLINSIKHLKKQKSPENPSVSKSLMSEVQLIKDDFILVSLRDSAAGFFAYLPAKRNLNDTLGKRQFEIGQINTVVIESVKDNRIIAKLPVIKMTKPTKKPVKAPQLEPGMITTATIQAIQKFQVTLTVGHRKGRIHICEVADNIEDGTNPLQSLVPKQEVRVKVLGYVDPKTFKNVETGKPAKKSLIDCTMRPSKLQSEGMSEDDVANQKIFKTGDKLTAFVFSYCHQGIWMQLTTQQRALLPALSCSDDVRVLKNLEKHFKVGNGYTVDVVGVGNNGNPELRMPSLSKEIHPGMVLPGYYRSTPNGELMVILRNRYTGYFTVTDVTDDYEDNPREQLKERHLVQCYVKSCNKNKPKCQVSLRKSRVEIPFLGTIRDKEYTNASQLEVGQVLRGYIVACIMRGVVICVGHNITGKCEFHNISVYKIDDPKSVYLPGKVVTVKILSIKGKHDLELSMLEEDTMVAESLPPDVAVGPKLDKIERLKMAKHIRDVFREKWRAEKRKPKEDTESPWAKKKKVQDDDSGVDLEDEVAIVCDDSQSEEDDAAKTGERLSVSAGFSWDNSFKLPDPESAEDDSDDSDDDEEQQTIKPKKTKQEKKEELRLEEQKLMQAEQMQLDKSRNLETADDFDRLVMQSPDSSVVWLRYMAFHLQSTEIEKARAVAERALKTISFREEQEKLNVWVAYMNLENLYGTQESLKKVFDQALERNEPLKVFQQLVNIYVRTEKIEAADQLYNTMVRRFSQNKQVWINFGMYYFKSGRQDMARKLMQRCLKSLDKRDHLEVISKFAQMEFKFSEPERGKTMFENVLANYPKRTDLWSVYIDMVIREGDPPATRHLFERVITLNLSAKKMKFFFKKFLDFEEKFGTEDNVNTVKQKAVAYVESKTTFSA